MRLARAAAPELCERAKSFFLHTRCRSEASGSSWVGFPGSLAMRWKLGSSLKASSLSETSRGASSSFRGVLQRALQVPAPRTPTLVGFPDSRQPVSQYDDPWRLFPEIWESSRRWAQTLAGRPRASPTWRSGKGGKGDRTSGGCWCGFWCGFAGDFAGSRGRVCGRGSC